MKHQTLVVGLLCLFISLSSGSRFQEVLDGQEAARRASKFPEDLGPFYLVDAGVQDDFVVSGDKQTWTAGDLSGELSPVKDISMPTLGETLGLGKDTIHGVAWAYPDGKNINARPTTPQALFGQTGGYVYFGNCENVLAVKAIAPSTSLLKFGPAEECVECELDKCPGATGFMPYPKVDIDIYKAFASDFCWIPPEMCERMAPRHKDGCFAFKKTDAYGFLLYPVATEQASGDFPQTLGPLFLADTNTQPSHISQWSPMALPINARQMVGVPVDSTGFAWGYGGANLAYGSFVYTPGNVVKMILPTQYKVNFGQAFEETATAADVDCTGKWHEVKNQVLQPGAKRYCWSSKLEESFVYEMQDGSLIRFPVESAFM